jgi:hypothetical protein
MPEVHLTATRRFGILGAGGLFGATTLICLVSLAFLPTRSAALALFSLGTGFGFLGGKNASRGHLQRGTDTGVITSLGRGLAVTLILFFMGAVVLERLRLPPISGVEAAFHDYGVRGYGSSIVCADVANTVRPNGTLTLYTAFVPDMPLCREPLLNAIHRGVTVRVLVLHPDSEIVRIHADESGVTSLEYRSDVISSLRLLQTVARELQPQQATRLEVRTYDRLPSMPIYIVDNPGRTGDVLYEGLFLARASLELPTMQFARVNGGFFEQLETYVEREWRKARPVNLMAVDLDACQQRLQCPKLTGVLQ